MLIGQEVGQIVSLVSTIFLLMWAGCLVSAYLYVGRSVVAWLSGFTRIDEPDPTEWFRLWRRLYDRYILPFGERAVSEHRSAEWNQILSQLGISVAVLAAAMGAYFLYSGTVIGAMLVSYYSMGVAPDLSHLIQPGAAGILLLAISVIFYSSERAVETA
jgi:hypothetical protein